MKKTVGFNGLVMRFLTNSWTVTLFATMVGAFTGVFLNDYYQSQKLIKGKQKALEKVMTEIKENKKELIEWDSIVDNFYNALKSLYDKMIDDDGVKIRMTPEEMAIYKKKFPDLFLITDSVLTEKNKYEYKGSINVVLNSRLAVFPLEDTQWSTFKQSHYIEYLNFECFTELEYTYKLQTKVNSLKEKWLSVVAFGVGLGDKAQRKETMINIDFSLQLGKSLITNYNNIESEGIDKCD